MNAHTIVRSLCSDKSPQSLRQSVEGDELGRNPFPRERLRNVVDEQRQIGRLGEIDGDLGGDVGRVAERREPEARRVLALERDQGPGERRSGARGLAARVVEDPSIMSRLPFVLAQRNSAMPAWKGPPADRVASDQRQSQLF